EGASTDDGCFGVGGATVLARTNVGRDLAALVQLRVDDLGSEPKVVAERADAELEHVALSADRTTACLSWNLYGGRSELSLLDLRRGAARPLPPAPGAVVSWCELSADGSRLVFSAEDPSRPRTVWILETAGGAPVPVTYRSPHVEPVAPLQPRLERFPAHDGL